MGLTEQCKKEIEEYVRSKGYDNNILFKNNNLIENYFYYSVKGIKLNFNNMWFKEPEKMNKYLFEFIGHILRKYNITKITITNHIKCSYNVLFRLDGQFQTKIIPDSLVY